VVHAHQDAMVLTTRRAHKYFPVHRAGANTMHLSRRRGRSRG
jgi:hypothetical protein